MSQQPPSAEEMTLPVAATVPEFASEAEEREWWASHDTSALPGEEVTLHRTGHGDHLGRALTIPTDDQTLAALKRFAEQRGLDYHDVARTWLRERLSEELAAS